MALALGLAFALGLGWYLASPAQLSLLLPQRGAWQPDLVAGMERSSRTGKPLLVLLAQPSAPLAARMAETVASVPVEQTIAVHFIAVRLDARENAELFRRWLGTAGALGSCILDVPVAGKPDVLAVLPGFADPARYLSFLNGAVQSLPRLRQLRQQADGSPSARLALADLYTAQASVANARQQLAAITTPTSLRAQALEREARLDVAAGQSARARETLAKARALDPNATSPRLVLTEALILSSERHVSQAVALLEGALPRLPAGVERDESLLLLGTLQHELARDLEALASLQRLRRESPNSSWARAAEEQIFHIEHPQPDHTH